LWQSAAICFDTFFATAKLLIVFRKTWFQQRRSSACTWPLAPGAAANVTPLLSVERRISLSSENKLHIEHTANPGHYYILYRGDDPAHIHLAVDLREAMGSSGILIDPAPPPREAFYWVREVPLNAPLDTDGDGIDDVTELRSGTDPLRDDSDGGGRPLVMASPQVTVILPRAPQYDLAEAGSTLARPPILLILPAAPQIDPFDAGLTLARPPLEVVLPAAPQLDHQDLGVTLARPPIGVVLPQAPHLEIEDAATILARPPVQVRFEPE
jgi:hypothetical protein